MLLGLPLGIWYVVAAFIVGFLAVMVVTIIDGPPSNDGEMIFTLLFAGILWPFAIVVIIGYALSKLGVALGLSLRNKWGLRVPSD